MRLERLSAETTYPEVGFGSARPRGSAIRHETEYGADSNGPLVAAFGDLVLVDATRASDGDWAWCKRVRQFEMLLVEVLEVVQGDSRGSVALRIKRPAREGQVGIRV
jgi:hypothetical protein